MSPETDKKKATEKTEQKVQYFKTKNDKAIKALLDDAIPLHKVVLKEPVIFSQTNIPENAFYQTGAGKTSRTAKIWFTPHGFIIEQNGEYKIIPGEQVKDSTIL